MLMENGVPPSFEGTLQDPNKENVSIEGTSAQPWTQTVWMWKQFVALSTPSASTKKEKKKKKTGAALDKNSSFSFATSLGWNGREGDCRAAASPTSAVWDCATPGLQSVRLVFPCTICCSCCNVKYCRTLTHTLQSRKPGCQLLSAEPPSRRVTVCLMLHALLYSVSEIHQVIRRPRWSGKMQHGAPLAPTFPGGIVMNPQRSLAK